MSRGKQSGTIVRIGNRWYVRYWEKRNVGGAIERKRVTHFLGPITTRGKRPPADIEEEADRHLSTLNTASIPAEQIVTVSDFVEAVYLPWIEQHKRPSTLKGYREIWTDHLQPNIGKLWLKNVRTHHVQALLDGIVATSKLSRNSLKHIKSVVSGIFKLAKQQAYFQGENPARDTAINPKATEPRETHAYDLDEVQKILARLPEPTSTAFAVAAYMGLRQGEIQGLRWEDYGDGQMRISRSIWNGRTTPPKTRKGEAPVPVIRQLADRLELHRLRYGNPQAGPIFANGAGNPLSLNSLVNRVILPALNPCEGCQKPQEGHGDADHKFVRDGSVPQWYGWHAARRGLASNLNRLGVRDVVIQRILRHAHVSTTTACYIKSADVDVHNAMATLENNIPETPLKLRDTYGTLKRESDASPATIQ